MAKVIVVYHSCGGNTARMATAVAEGAEKAGADVLTQPVQTVKAEDLLQYDGIIIGSPTYYGLLSAPLKALLDETVKFHGKLTGKVGGAFTTSANIGGGNETTILSILQAMLIHGMIVQGTAAGDHYGPVGIGKPDDRALQGARELGRRVAELAARLTA